MNATATIENGIITAITINGKPCKPGFMRGLKKAQATSYWRLAEGGLARNPFTDEECTLTALEMSIYLWLVGWYARYSAGGPKRAGAPIQAYDDVKYGFSALNHGAYMALID